jgi:hypothetical protein
MNGFEPELVLVNLVGKTELDSNASLSDKLITCYLHLSVSLSLTVLANCESNLASAAMVGTYSVISQNCKVFSFHELLWNEKIKTSIF